MPPMTPLPLAWLLALFTLHAADAPPPSSAVRIVPVERVVALDAAALRTHLRHVGHLRLADANGAPLDVHVTDERPGALGGTIFRADVAGDPHARARLVVHGSVVRADVTSPSLGSLTLRPLADGAPGLHRLRLDREPPPPCLGALADAGPTPSGAPLGPFAERRRPAPPGETIDVMVVYTPSARLAAGGPAGIAATIEAFVDYTHTAYEASGVLQRLRLVHAGEVAYVESGNSITDLARLKTPGDGFLDEVHAIRDAVGADCVSLIATSGSAGVGYQMTPPFADFEDRAFSTVSPEGSGIAFAHELGHNMGCGHNNGPAVPAAAFCFSFGHRTPDAMWRTIMSNAPGEHVNLFSSPALRFGGFPLGVDGTGCPVDAADCVESLNRTASAVAAFRPTRVP